MDINEELFWALAELNVARASTLSASGADINGFTDSGERVWSFVVGSPEATKMAFEFGADPNLIDTANCGSLYWSIYAKNPEIAKILIAHGAKVDFLRRSDKFNLLHEAALAGKADVLSVLVDAAPDDLLTETNMLDRTPLEEAEAAGHTDCADLLRRKLKIRFPKNEPRSQS